VRSRVPRKPGESRSARCFPKSRTPSMVAYSFLIPYVGSYIAADLPLFLSFARDGHPAVFSMHACRFQELCTCRLNRLRQDVWRFLPDDAFTIPP
jgi:hypothetical protein